MKKSEVTLLIFLLIITIAGAQTPWQSELLAVGNNGSLTYHADSNGFKIPDFSHAGYKGGDKDLPEVATVKTISPVSGDNTKHIQDAIDYIGNLPKNADGIRGALLLNAGKYDVYGSLYVKYDGVVLRGVGDGENPAKSTIIYARGNTPDQRTVITLGNTSQINGTKQISNTKSNITDAKVDVGSTDFSVENATLYNVGDRIIIYHPASQGWIEAVNQGGVPYPDPSAPTDPDERWKVNQLPINYNRYITAINGNQITVDAPVFYTLNKSVSPCYIYKPDMTGLVNQVGLENLRIDIETLGGENEAHAWQAVRYKSCENAWARNCTFIHFGQSGIITEACSRSTFTDCKAIDPVAIITGERMYNFNTYVYSQLNLFKNCYASNGRHHYVSNGTSSTSGNVFLRCTSDATNSVNEGHRQWTQGMLYDNHKEINLKRDFVLGLYNRVAMGTGHGWAAVHSFLWNCDVDSNFGKIGLQKPPTGQNYAIGCLAKTITGNPVSATNFTKGYVEGHNKTGLIPESLYEAQLAERKKSTANIPIKQNLSFEVYPTIATNFVQVRMTENSLDSVIQIRDITGKLFLEKHFSGKKFDIDIGKFSRGIYLITCQTQFKNYYSRIIKI
ncbi:MAG TPA: T9SS type A sorting domain-containing protein [Paludibacter sp.]|nr:T9SS type A sorting domain-containing protein [Paludibacter sp.]